MNDFNWTVFTACTAIGAVAELLTLPRAYRVARWVASVKVLVVAGLWAWLVPPPLNSLAVAGFFVARAGDVAQEYGLILVNRWRIWRVTRGWQQQRQTEGIPGLTQ